MSSIESQIRAYTNKLSLLGDQVMLRIVSDECHLVKYETELSNLWIDIIIPGFVTHIDCFALADLNINKLICRHELSMIKQSAFKGLSIRRMEIHCKEWANGAFRQCSIGSLMASSNITGEAFTACNIDELEYI